MRERERKQALQKHHGTKQKPQLPKYHKKKRREPTEEDQCCCCCCCSISAIFDAMKRPALLNGLSLLLQLTLDSLKLCHGVCVCLQGGLSWWPLSWASGSKSGSLRWGAGGLGKGNLALLMQDEECSTWWRLAHLDRRNGECD